MSALVIFRVDEQHYALSIEAVTEIMPIMAVSRVPQMPGDWYGIANIRGIVTPIIDLRAHYRLPTIEPGLSAPIIILRQNQRQLGLLVDHIEDIRYHSQDASVELHDGQLVVVLEAEAFFIKTPDIAERRN